jgi:hypothetical protein
LQGLSLSAIVREPESFVGEIHSEREIREQLSA